MAAATLAFAILAGLLILLLASPIAAAFRFTGIAEVSGQITIGWLFGLLHFRIRLPGRDGSSVPSKRASAANIGPERSRRQGWHSRAAALLRGSPFRRRSLRLAADLLRAAHLRGLHLHLRLGLGDPAETGRLWAIMGPLSALAQALPEARVQIEPEFMEATLEFEAQGRLRLIPAQILALLVGFALSPVSIRAWRSLRVGHA